MESILQGIRILDLTRILAGPFATRILADFGAEVIKIQTGRLAKEGESVTTPGFVNWNRNKRSITLNLNEQRAREIFLELVSHSDIVVENFSPRVMPNWGLDYDQLYTSNRKLIMLSMSACGQTGPWKDFVGFGPTVQSLGGLTYLTSYSNDFPIGLGYAYADQISGLYAAAAILAALDYRERTGLGQYIDLSEYEAVCTTVAPALMGASLRQEQTDLPGSNERNHPAAPHDCFKCRGEDRWCVIAVFSEDEWTALCRVMGDPAWTQSPHFSSMRNRLEYKEELKSHIEQWTLEQQAEGLVVRLQKAGVPAGLVQSAQDLSQDQQLLAREFFRTLDHPLLGRVQTEALPFQLIPEPQKPWKASPLLGEANQYVFRELLGMSEEEIQSCVEQNIIA